jgi:hypothetical protein
MYVVVFSVKVPSGAFALDYYHPQRQGGTMDTRDFDRMENLEQTIVDQAISHFETKRALQEVEDERDKIERAYQALVKKSEEVSFSAVHLAKALEEVFQAGMLPLPLIDQKGMVTVSVDPKSFRHASEKSGALLSCCVRFQVGQGYQTSPISFFLQPVPDLDDSDLSKLWPGYSPPTWKKKVLPAKRRRKAPVTAKTGGS